MTGVHIALLRGINVGKAKRIAMADLRRVVTSAGYRNVRTLLNSGNVVFTAPATLRGEHATRIQAAIAGRLGVETRVLVLSAPELKQVLEENRLAAQADNPSRLLVALLADPAHRARLLPLVREAWEPEALAVGTRAAYLWCPDGILQSRVGEAVSRVLRDATTARNWATMLKLQQLAAADG